MASERASGYRSATKAAKRLVTPVSRDASVGLGIQARFYLQASAFGFQLSPYGSSFTRMTLAASLRYVHAANTPRAVDANTGQGKTTVDAWTRQKPRAYLGACVADPPRTVGYLMPN